MFRTASFTFIILLLCLLTHGASSQTRPLNDKPPKRVETPKVTFDKQLQVFRELGFELNAGIPISELDTAENRALSDKSPFSYLYIHLGRESSTPPYKPISDRCWDFDLESVEDHGDYIAILKNLERICRGAVKFENIKDFVDIEQQVAWVSFSFKGRSYKWNLKAEDDWADPELLSKIVTLLARYKMPGRYTYFDTGGQNAVIGFETGESLKRIKAATGLNIIWLK